MKGSIFTLVILLCSLTSKSQVNFGISGGFYISPDYNLYDDIISSVPINTSYYLINAGHRNFRFELTGKLKTPKFTLSYTYTDFEVLRTLETNLQDKKEIRYEGLCSIIQIGKEFLLNYNNHVVFQINAGIIHSYNAGFGIKGNFGDPESGAYFGISGFEAIGWTTNIGITSYINPKWFINTTIGYQHIKSSRNNFFIDEFPEADILTPEMLIYSQLNFNISLGRDFSLDQFLKFKVLDQDEIVKEPF